MEKCKKVTSTEWYKLSDDFKKANVVFHAIPEKCGKDKTKSYVPRAMLNDMLNRQVKLACYCGVLCNYGERKSKKAGIKAYVNCGLNRERKSRALECGYYGQTLMKSDFMWKHAQRIVNCGDGSTTKINEQSLEERKRKREAELEIKDLGVCFPCPVCAYEPARIAALTEEEKKALKVVLERFVRPK
jgi:hypothetical protein